MDEGVREVELDDIRLERSYRRENRVCITWLNYLNCSALPAAEDRVLPRQTLASGMWFWPWAVNRVRHSAVGSVGGKGETYSCCCQECCGVCFEDFFFLLEDIQNQIQEFTAGALRAFQRSNSLKRSLSQISLATYSESTSLLAINATYSGIWQKGKIVIMLCRHMLKVHCVGLRGSIVKNRI